MSESEQDEDEPWTVEVEEGMGRFLTDSGSLSTGFNNETIDEIQAAPILTDEVVRIIASSEMSDADDRMKLTYYLTTEEARELADTLDAAITTTEQESD